MKHVKLLALLAIVFIASSFKANAQTSVALESEITPVTFTPGNNAVKFFSRQHPFVTNAHWSLLKDGYKVRYQEEGRTGMDYFNDNGQWEASTRYLPIDQIPENVMESVNNSYPKYSVFFAQDVKTPSGFVHIIKIENDDNWKTLCICNGDVQVIENFNKH